MADVGKPKAKGTKGAPPQVPSQNLTKDDESNMVGLNFKTPPAFRKEFKGYALDRDLTMNELLLKCFSFYKESQK